MAEIDRPNAAKDLPRGNQNTIYTALLASFDKELVDMGTQA